jgi:hypothetical protein
VIFAVASLLAYRVGDRPDRPSPSARGQVDCRIFLEDAGHMDCDAQAIPYDGMTRVCAGWSSAELRLGAGLLVKQHSKSAEMAGYDTCGPRLGSWGDN